jgi:redox-sensitive bicupin YhaK (pirin superfamily)
LRVVASPDGRDGSVTIHADATLYAGLFDGAEQLDLPLDVARKTYVHLAQGTLNVNGEVLKAGDALKLEGENRLSLSHGQQAEVLVFDLGV